jgi:hypothetical protein
MALKAPDPLLEEDLTELRNGLKLLTEEQFKKMLLDTGINESQLMLWQSDVDSADRVQIRCILHWIYVNTKRRPPE